MNIVTKAYGNQHLIFSSEFDAESMQNYMLGFCDVSHWNLEGYFWANVYSDGSFLFQNNFAFTRNGYKQLWLNAQVLPAENGCVVEVDVKCNPLVLIIINVFMIAIGLLILYGSFEQGFINSDLGFPGLFFLFVMPGVLLASTIYQKNYLLKKFVRQFKLASIQS